MGSHWPFAVAGAMLVAGSGLAQVPGVLPASPGREVASFSETPVPTLLAEPAAHAPSYWASAEYLLWWIKPVCLNVPVVSVGNPNDPIPGAIGQPGTQVIGYHKFEFSGLSGARLNVGCAL